MKSPAASLTSPFVETAVLKENRYKKVSLMEDVNGNKFIKKAYQGRKDEHCRANAAYAFQMLQFFFENFSSVARIPQPFGLESTGVYLEFLPELTQAKLLNRHTIKFADPFFDLCYSGSLNAKIFRGIEQSVYFNDSIKAWLATNKPLSIGLKGDLWQNLCSHQGQLILADIDSAAIEPLGLSELVMRANIAASLNATNLSSLFASEKHKPVCYSKLDVGEAEALIEIVLQFVSSGMVHLSAFMRSTKLRLAHRALISVLDNPA